MSETTKRIEEILGSYLFCEDKSPKGLVNELDTHLHQEVIRGKIEELEEIPCGYYSNTKGLEQRIADLTAELEGE